MLNFEPFGCTYLAIKNDVPHQLWAGITQANQAHAPLWLIRLIYNKARFYPQNFLQCYVHYFSPKFLITQLGWLKFFFLVLILILTTKKYPFTQRPILLLILLYPIVFFFELTGYL